MTGPQLLAEATVRATLAHATDLLMAGIITRADYERIEQALITTYTPPISRLKTAL